MNSCEQMARFLREQSDYLLQLRQMDPMEMYRAVVDWARELPPFSEEDRTEAHLVPGCLSEVYVAGHCREGKMYYSASADTQIIGGMLKVFLEAINGLSPDDICTCVQQSIDSFSKAIDIRATLTPTRANAFANIFGHIQRQAESFC